MHLICLAGWVLRMQILRQNVGARCLLGINTCEEEERKQTWTGKNLRRPWPTQEAALKRLLPIIVWGGSLVAQSIKNLPAMQETQVWSLNQEDTLEKEMAFHSSNSCLGNPVDRGAWRATVHGVTKSRLSNFHLCETDEVLFFPISSYMCGWILLNAGMK